MINLAGVKLYLADVVCSAELREANIISGLTDPGCAEVQTTVMGRVGGWTFHRAWYYWIAKAPAGHGLTRAQAEALRLLCGTVVRPNGCAASTIYDSDVTVDLYHIDTQFGLNLFAALVVYENEQRDNETEIMREAQNASDLLRTGGIDDLLSWAEKTR